MSFRKRLGVIAIFVCVSFFSCEKKPPDGTPIFTEQPESASYFVEEKIKRLFVNASAEEGYDLSYQWCVMRYSLNEYHANPTEQEISTEFNKLIDGDPEDSKFYFWRGGNRKVFNPLEISGVSVYVCIVTSTSEDGSKSFTAVSDPAIISIIRHPLTYWYITDRDLFEYDWRHGGYIQLKDITYGNGYFVAVGNIGPGSWRYGKIAYSNDGRTWELVENRNSQFGDDGNNIYAVAYGGDRFVAVGGRGKIAYSTDVKTWIPVESIVTESFMDIVFGNGVFLANYGSGLAYSDNGETWFAVEDIEDFAGSWISCIAYANDHFIAGSNNGKISYSQDGKTWTTITDDTFDSHAIVTICYGNGCYLAFARQYNDHAPSSYKMGYSSNGKKWIEVTPSPFDEKWNWIKKIIYSEGYFIAIGDDKIAYSEDGKDWKNLGESYKQNFSGFGRSLYYNAIAYGDDHFVVVSDNGIIYYCQWPITKAIAPKIKKHPIWPVNGFKLIDQERVQVLEINTELFSFGEYSYQWYRNDIDSNSGGIAIEGANHYYYPPDVSKPGTTYYYVKVTNTIYDYYDVKPENRSASVISNTVAVTVDYPEDAIPEKTAINELSK